MKIFVLVFASFASVAPAQSTQPAFVFPPPDPVPHEIITQPYRVCQDLEELTARINNVYRKPLHKLFDSTGAGQPETIFFKDVTSGHEVMSLTRELCTDIAHADLARPIWTVDGRRILFMGNRALIDKDGRLKNTPWQGKMYQMNADYTDQRAMIVEMLDEQGKSLGKADGMPGKYNILDPIDPSIAYYAAEDKLYRVTFADDPAKPAQARQIATFATKHKKIIQAISRDRKLLIQDLNADFDRKIGKPLYMPEIHLVDLNKQPGEAGFYDHHPFDYGLPEVRGANGEILHDASNNYQFHSLMFGPTSDSIGWNYGPMTQVGEYLGWSLDIRNGLAGKPQHGAITRDGGGNPFGQYESHGRYVGGTRTGLYFSGPVKVGEGKIGQWGLWMRDYANNTPPTFLLPAAGGHVAGGESFNPHYFAAHIGATSPEWRRRVKESDAIVFGDVRSPEQTKVLCYTYSDVRGGTRVDRQTGRRVWSGMDNNDFRPYTSIPRPLLSRDATKVWFHSSMLMPTTDWTGIYIAVLRKPDAPVELKLENAEPGVKLSWKPAGGAVETRGYRVYRIDGKGEAVDLTPELVPARDDKKQMLAALTFHDQTAMADGTHTYFVTAEEWSGLESDTTSEQIVYNRATGSPPSTLPAMKGFDTTAPPAVEGFAATREEPGQYRLHWTPSPAGDVRYYNVYFSSKEKPQISQRRLIASPLKSKQAYLDWTAPLEGEAFYAITAVDRQGNESAPAFVSGR